MKFFQTGLSSAKATRLIYSIIFILSIIGCTFNETRSSVIVGNIRVEGRIGKDTVYDGLLKFYDTRTNSLIEEGYYKNGVHDGLSITYQKNGKVSTKSSFKDGEVNGYTYVFDAAGDTASYYYSYYGIKAGGSITFENKKIRYYRFYSLENEVLFSLDYDSVKGRRLTDIQSGYFFYLKRDYKSASQDDSAQKVEYFLYTPNPPKFNLKYSLIFIDSNRKTLSVIKEFDNRKPWAVFDLDTREENPNKILALQLLITDSINNQKTGMIRSLIER